jgi:hypothetical protein
MGMGIRYDHTHTIHTVLLLIFDTVHTAPYGGEYGGPGPVTQCHSGTGRHGQLRELSVGLIRGNFSLYRASVGMLARSSGRSFRAGLSVPTDEHVV